MRSRQGDGEDWYEGSVRLRSRRGLACRPLPRQALARESHGSRRSRTRTAVSVERRIPLATPVQSTAEVLRAYQSVGQQSQPSFAPALAYLNADAEENTEFLARKIVVNAAAGGDISALVTALLAHQNADGGFGDRPLADSTAFDL